MAIKRKYKPSVEFSSASIADIVFLLLIYFILTSSFVTQSSIKVELPTSTSDKPSPGKNFVTLSAEGVYAWNDLRLNSREELIPFIEGALTDATPDNDVITLRVDKRVTFEEAAFVMSLVAENEGKIVILTEKQ